MTRPSSSMYEMLESEPQPDASPGPNYWKREGNTRAATFVFYLTCASAMVSSLLALSLLVHSSRPHPNYFVGTTVPNSKDMRRPSTYVGLEKVFSSNVTRSEPFPIIINFPPVLLQISANDPSRTLREESRQYLSYEGTVFPDDRRFVVSKMVSTIAQFNNLDYGMERCSIHASIPIRSDKFDPEADLEMEHSPSVVDVWILGETGELSPQLLTWESAPARTSLLTSFPMSTEKNSSSGEFNCPSGRFTTLEFSCSNMSISCRVEFWQTRALKIPAGVYMSQRDSLVLFHRHSQGVGTITT